MTPFEVVAGSMEVWLAPVGTAFPLIIAVPAVAWVRIGTNGNANQDEDGLAITHNKKQEIVRAAGRLGPIKAFTIEEDQMISLKNMDITLEQYSIVMNKAAVTTTAAGVGTAGVKRMRLNQGADPATYALLMRGPGMSPYGDALNLQYQIPRVFESANAKPVFRKGKPATLDIEFTTLEDLANPALPFGEVLGQHQAPLP